MKNILSAGLVLLLIMLYAPESAISQNWWNTNSLKLESIPEGTLFHAEGEYNFTHLTGNVDMYLHTGSPSFYVRNGRTMFTTYAKINYQKIQVGDNRPTRNRSFTINPKFIYDLTPVFQSETGVLWERDESHYLDRRVVAYTGIIYNLLESKDFGKLFFGAVGYQHARSTEFLPILPVTEENKPILYAQQRLIVRALAPVVFVESFTFIKELDEEASYRTDLTLRAIIPLSQKTNFVITHITKYESEPLIHVLAPYVEKFNTTLAVGVKFNF
jgi:hypothetical protein